MKRSFWLEMAIIAFLIVSCEDDAADFKAMLPGYWGMQTAFRDSRETTLLNDVFFQFEATGKMVTNLPNTPAGPTEFELKEHVILQKTANPVEYNILGMTDSTLVLALTIRNTPFEFHLKKTSPPVPKPEAVQESVQ